MPLQENDISWDVLRQIVHAWAGARAELIEVRHLVGGCVNTTVALTTADGGRAVLKISPHRVSRELQRESHQLHMLKKLGLPVPQVYASHVATLDNPNSYILMEFVDGVDLNIARKRCSPEEFDGLQQHLAELVLSLHANTSTHYHRHEPEEPQRFDSWAEFYRHVYSPIWGELEKSPTLPVKARRQIERVHDRLDRLLAHDDQPRLVHWDIWAANVLTKPDGQGRWRITALLDPNCKYAHAEAEIAYMELFNTITPAFLKTYQKQRPLAETYHRVRKPIYQLFPLINDVNLFGNGYLKPLLAMLDRVAPLL